MTPESYAAQILAAMPSSHPDAARLFLVGAIAQIVAETRAAERDACAAIADAFIPSGFRDGSRSGELFGIARDDRARTIAAAIRARALLEN